MTTKKTRGQKPDYNRRVPAVEQAARILFCLAESPRAELSLTEICGRVGIHKSKGYSILNTLMEFALVSRDSASKGYALGAGLLSLSRAALDKTDLRRVAAPFLGKLAEQTGSTALLGMLQGDRVFVVAKEESGTGIGVTIRVGHRYPLGWGAHGKAIAASLPEGERQRLLAEGRLRLPADVADSAAIERELELVRHKGYAKDLGKMQPGIHAVAAPIYGAGPGPVGCVIVVGTFAKARADGFGEAAAAVAREISGFFGSTLERVYRKAG